MPESAPTYEEWRDAMFRILGETEYFTSLRARAPWVPDTSKGARDAHDAMSELDVDDECEYSRWWKFCTETLSPSTRLQWLALLCRESGRHAADRIRAEEFATLLHMLVSPSDWHWTRDLCLPEFTDEAIDAIRSFAVLYRDFFGPLLGDDLNSGPGQPAAVSSEVHFLCAMLWDMSPLGILEGPVRDAVRTVLAEALDLPSLSCQASAIFGVYFYSLDPAFADLARAYLRRPWRLPEYIHARTRYSAGE